nr:MAG TPA: hypothetical protein [Inoviridae sp.]
MEVVITRRFFSFFLAGVIAASTIFPVSAWNKDSFISGGEEYEPSADVALSDVYAAPRRARMFKVSAVDQAAAETNTTGKLVVPATLPSSVDGTFEAMSKYYYYHPAQSTPPLPKSEMDYWRDVVATFSASPFFSSDWLHIFVSTVVYSANVSDPSEMVRGLALFCDKDKGVFPPGYVMVGSSGGDMGTNSWSFTVNYDVSAYASSAFSLDGISSYCILISGPYTNNIFIPTYALSVDVLVDGQQVLTLSRGTPLHIDFGGYVYSGSSNVSTISFRWHMPFYAFVFDGTAYDGNYIVALKDDILMTNPQALTISFLDGQDVINAQNNKTKEDINKHEEYESQWTGSMTENFNKLDVGNFTFHSGLIAGFALVSGIFMDIWNAMGNAAVVYVFPLTLGVVLMLLGRIGRTGGKRGSEDGEDTS